jgi:hypothetical protein
MQKTYVIREAFFMYNDECFVPQGWTRVVERFSEQHAAQARARELARGQFSSVAGALHEWTFDEPEKEATILAFAAKHFPKELAKAKKAGTESYEILRSLALPQTLSNALKDELLALVDAKFYDVFAFAAEPILYRPQANAAFFGDSKPQFELDESGFPLLCNTKQEALTLACEHVYYAVSGQLPGLVGSYEELSHSPEALAALVADGVGGEKLFEKTPNGIVVAQYADETLFRHSMLALASLLKAPPFVLEELSFDQAQALRSNYEADEPDDDFE